LIRFNRASHGKVEGRDQKKKIRKRNDDQKNKVQKNKVQKDKVQKDKVQKNKGTATSMSSLNASLNVALSGLSAEQDALEATTNNVANVNTPGYSRQVPVLVSSEPVVEDPLTLGTGVTLQSVESIRDPLLESQIQQETQVQGQFNTLSAALQQTQVNFTSSTSDIGTQISNFFTSINQLSTSPSDLSVRQGVLTAAGDLATSFNNTANNLTQQQGSLDLSVVQNVGQINQLTTQIAQLNGQISDLQNAGESAGSFIDQRTLAIDQLSNLTDISVIPSNNTITVTTGNGTALVTGQQSYTLTTQLKTSGLHDVYSQGADITSSITSGELGGTLQARDQQIPALTTQLDTLASGLAKAVNGVQAAGFDLTGAAGTNLFTPPPASGVGAAASLSVAITDPSLIAASSDGSAGSNGNAEALYALGTAPIISGQTPSDYYSGVVFNVGNDVSNASAEQTASGLALQQLNDQRSSISGVSLDEEAANMVRYQNAYAAAAQIVTTINDMLYTTVNMATLTG
jgi:flagellar hook-associated protein 1 FlgK